MLGLHLLLIRLRFESLKNWRTELFKKIGYAQKNQETCDFMHAITSSIVAHVKQ